MRPAVRFAVTVVLLAALVGLCVHHGATYDERWPHPTGDQLRDEYDAYVGERVLLFGGVRAVDGDAGTITVHVTDSADAVAAELEVDGVDEPVAPGGAVQVYGTLEGDRTMTADRAVVVNRDATAARYKLAASVAGVLLAVGYFLRYWRPTARRVGFEPRAGSKSRSRERVADAAESTTSAEGSRDG